MNETRKARIILLDQRSIEIPVTARMLVSELTLLVANQSDVHPDQIHFGLAFVDSRGDLNWLDPERPVLDYEYARGKMLSTGQLAPFTLYHLVKFYVTCVTELQNICTVELFFLQAVSALAKGKLNYTKLENVHLLVGYILQALLGNSNRRQDTELNVIRSLSLGALNQDGDSTNLMASLVQTEHKILEKYRSLSGLPRGEAVINFMQQVQQHPCYGVHAYEVTDKSGTTWVLGLGAEGIYQFDPAIKTTPKWTFPWRHLENLYHRDKKFSIEVTNSTRVVHALSSANLFEHPTSSLNTSIDADTSTTSDTGGDSNAEVKPNGRDDDLSHAIADPTTRMSASRRTFGTSSVRVHSFFCASEFLCKNMWALAVAQHQFHSRRQHSKKSIIPTSKPVKSIETLTAELNQLLEPTTTDKNNNLGTAPNSETVIDNKHNNEDVNNKTVHHNDSVLRNLASALEAKMLGGPTDSTSTTRLGSVSSNSTLPSLASASELGVFAQLSTSSLQSNQSVTSGKSRTEKDDDALATFKQLRSRKEALEDLISQKLAQLKEVCIEEGGKTGELPPEIGRCLAPGEAPPAVQRRVGTDYTLPPELMKQKSDQRSEQIRRMAVDAEMQRKIAAALYKLAQDPSASKQVRMKRNLEYQQANQNHKEIVAKLHHLRLSQSRTDVSNILESEDYSPLARPSQRGLITRSDIPIYGLQCCDKRRFGELCPHSYSTPKLTKKVFRNKSAPSSPTGSVENLTSLSTNPNGRAQTGSAVPNSQERHIKLLHSTSGTANMPLYNATTHVGSQVIHSNATAPAPLNVEPGKPHVAEPLAQQTSTVNFIRTLVSNNNAPVDKARKSAARRHQKSSNNPVILRRSISHQTLAALPPQDFEDGGEETMIPNFLHPNQGHISNISPNLQLKFSENSKFSAFSNPVTDSTAKNRPPLKRQLSAASATSPSDVRRHYHQGSVGSQSPVVPVFTRSPFRGQATMLGANMFNNQRSPLYSPGTMYNIKNQRTSTSFQSIEDIKKAIPSEHNPSEGSNSVHSNINNTTSQYTRLIIGSHIGDNAGPTTIPAHLSNRPSSASAGRARQLASPNQQHPYSRIRIPSRPLAASPGSEAERHRLCGNAPTSGRPDGNNVNYGSPKPKPATALSHHSDSGFRMSQPVPQAGNRPIATDTSILTTKLANPDPGCCVSYGSLDRKTYSKRYGAANKISGNNDVSPRPAHHQNGFAERGHHAAGQHSTRYNQPHSISSKDRHFSSGPNSNVLDQARSAPWCSLKNGHHSFDHSTGIGSNIPTGSEQRIPIPRMQAPRQQRPFTPASRQHQPGPNRTMNQESLNMLQQQQQQRPAPGPQYSNGSSPIRSPVRTITLSPAPTLSPGGATEVTKPFEAADAYKYSPRYRRMQLAGGQQHQGMQNAGPRRTPPPASSVSPSAHQSQIPGLRPAARFPQPTSIRQKLVFNPDQKQHRQHVAQQNQHHATQNHVLQQRQQQNRNPNRTPLQQHQGQQPSAVPQPRSPMRIPVPPAPGGDTKVARTKNESHLNGLATTNRLQPLKFQGSSKRLAQPSSQLSLRPAQQTMQTKALASAAERGVVLDASQSTAV